MDYMDEVRSRKHDMKSHICQLTSAIKNIEYDLVHKNDKNIFSSEKEWLDDMMEEVKNQSFAIKHLNTILDIFSREDKFGNPEVINIGKFISENIVAGKKYKVVHNTDYDALRDYGFDVPEKESNHEFFKGLIKIKIKYELEDEEIEDANVFVAKDDLLRLFDNIINNAVTHGFTEDSKDYCIKTNLSVDPQRNMFQIDITNNGTPLPKGLDKHRYGIKGETAGKTGKSGEGGYIVKSIVEHYKGDFDIFTEDKGKHTLTTVRIFLPIYRTYGK
jgi:sensor histidine kinase regulating citrate/malate metabolism